jgi:hypothetical protein
MELTCVKFDDTVRRIAGFLFVSFVGSRVAKQVLVRFFYGNTSHSIVKLDACQFHLFIMVLSIF